MADNHRLSNFISRTVSGPMWHGPSLSELLDDVQSLDAARHPIPNAHSIWEVTLHMAAWAEIAHDRLVSLKELPDPTTEQDWPVMQIESQKAWEETKNRLFTAYRELAEAAGDLPLDRLQRIIPGRTYSAQEMLHGVIEHGAYHGGQIAVLKRSLTHVAASRETAEIPEK
jgi:uncharacterized damage-inducible protein DinB